MLWDFSFPLCRRAHSSSPAWRSKVEGGGEAVQWGGEGTKEGPSRESIVYSYSQKQVNNPSSMLELNTLKS